MPRLNRTRILALALGLRGALIIAAWLLGGGSADPFLAPDSVAYLETAASLATTGEFARLGLPDIVRTPGYPALLVPGVWLGSPVVWGLVLQLALAALMILALADLARQLAGPKAGMVAALLLAIEPLSLIYTAKLLTETAFSTLLVGAGWGLLRGYLRDQERPFLFGAVCLGLSALVRPIGQVLALVLVVLAVIALIHRRFTGAGPLRIGWLTAAMGLLLLPSVTWQARNLVVADYRGLSAITDINLYFYQAAAVTAAQQGRSYYDVQDELGYHDVEIFNAQRPDLQALPPGPRFHQLGQEGRQIVAANLFTYLGIHLQGMLRVIIDPGLLATLQHVVRTMPWVLLVEGSFGCLLLMLYAGSARGLVWLGRQHLVLALLFLGAMLLLLFAAGGPMSLSRFRHPLMPMLCLLTALGMPQTRSEADQTWDA